MDDQVQRVATVDHGFAFQLKAEILSYSRTQGLFAGINLSGGVLRPDEDANRNVYGSTATPRTILASREISAPTQAAAFLSALGRGAPAPAQTTAAPPPRTPASATSSAPAATATDADLRARIADMQQTLDSLLADSGQEPVGTTGTSATATPGSASSTRTVTIERARLLQLRQQLDALTAALERRR